MSTALSKYCVMKNMLVSRDNETIVWVEHSIGRNKKKDGISRVFTWENFFLFEMDSNNTVSSQWRGKQILYFITKKCFSMYVLIYIVSLCISYLF